MSSTLFLINLERTRAYKVEGTQVTKVEFKFIQLGDFKEVEASVLHQKVGDKDLSAIRRLHLPCEEKAFNEIALKGAMYSLNQLLPESEHITAGDLLIEKY